MKNLMRSLFGARPQAKPAPSALPPGHDNPLTIEDGSDNAIRRQLVHVLLRDVLRRHGIPPQWIECQMLVVASRSRGPGMYVRLVLRHWDERLMHYAYALQNALLADMARFEPQAGEWLHGISWQLELADTCPYRTLPDKSFWMEPVKTASPAPVAPVAPVVAPVVQAIPPVQAVQAAPAAEENEENEARQDLERLFLIRDQEIGKQAADGQAPVDYEKTQPSPL